MSNIKSWSGKSDKDFVDSVVHDTAKFYDPGDMGLGSGIQDFLIKFPNNNCISRNELIKTIMEFDFSTVVPVPGGLNDRKPLVSPEEAKRAVQTAKAAVKVKSKSEGTKASGDSYTDDEDLSPNKSKRVLANRQSAHRSRQRKLQQIQEIESTLDKIHEEINRTRPLLVMYREKYTGLTAQNQELTTKIVNLLKKAKLKNPLSSLGEQISKQLLTLKEKESSNFC